MIDELYKDHEKILAKLDELEQATTQVVDKNKVKEFLDFSENFAEPHHHKEEDVLFPALEKAGIPNEGGPIGMMLYEHETKRGYIKDLQGAVAKDDDAKIKETSQAIISLLRDHINKEDNILYPCAKDALSPEELEKLKESISYEA